MTISEPPVAGTSTQPNLAGLETCEQIIREQIPNFLRVVLNPAVAQTALCLHHHAAQFARGSVEATGPELFPSFIANSIDEALSGAVKLARFSAAERRKVVVVDPDQRFPHFGYSKRADGSRVEFIPDVVRVPDGATIDPNDVGILVLAGSIDCLEEPRLSELWQSRDVVTVRCQHANVGRAERSEPRQPPADIVVFDESFVDRAVPFAAFSARSELLSPWMHGKMSLFHSTTFQPNAIAAMHFMRCWHERNGVVDEATSPDGSSAHGGLVASSTTEGLPSLSEVPGNFANIATVFEKLYSPSLAKLVRTIGFGSTELSASGHYFTVGSKRVLDGVAGVACSIRGHNPAYFADEIRTAIADTTDLPTALGDAIELASGFTHYVPAVSGAAAVENALKLARTAQPEREYVLALKGGFGGKTLVALTGTARDSYKQDIGPLYDKVIYADPFAPDAVDQITRLFQRNPIGVVQLELIQGVGGVKPIPSAVVELLDAKRAEHDYFLFVDEVQTGMFRTGPFLRSQDLGIEPDLVSLGKGTSDMMFPFSATLFNDRVNARLQDQGSMLPGWIRQRYRYPIGEAAMLNSLRRANAEDWTNRVRHQAKRFEECLRAGLDGSPNVSDIRVFGMLMGIELNASRTTLRWLGKRAAKLYSLAMLNHSSPLLMGFCQYEPNVFKLTPSLLMDDELIDVACNTICETLRRAPLSVLGSAVSTLVRNKLK